MTENKRYFERRWEEEYYIFDSEKISEKEFDEKLEYEDYKAFEDSMGGDEVVNKLNEQDKKLKNRKKLNNILEGFLLAEGYTFNDIIKWLQEKTESTPKEGE